MFLGLHLQVFYSILSFFTEFVRAFDYFGVSVGSFEGSDVEGEVFLVNSTHLQILDFSAGKASKLGNYSNLARSSNISQHRQLKI